MSSQVSLRARKMLAGAGVLIMALTMGACGDGDDDTVTGSGDIEIGNLHRYEPDELKIRPNQEITISIANNDDEVHNFGLSFLDIDKDIPAGQRVDVKIPAAPAPRDGFYSFYCKYHQTEGMQGKLTVAT